jgi:hypothetical protein
VSLVRFALGTVTYRNEGALEEPGQAVFSAIAAGAARIMAGLVVVVTLRRLAKAPAPGISTAQAPVNGGFCAARTPELVVRKFSVMLRKPVLPATNVPSMIAVGT